jgi:hypothetical protein
MKNARLAGLKPPIPEFIYMEVNAVFSWRALCLCQIICFSF